MAKKFKFRLQTVLDLKTKKVEETTEKLNVALRNKYQQEQIVAKKIEEKNSHLKSSSTRVLKVSQMQALRDHISALEEEILAEKKTLAGLIEIENKCRAALNEAKKEEKVLLKLQEKKILKHKQELQKEETSFLDEIASHLYIRKLK